MNHRRVLVLASSCLIILAVIVGASHLDVSSRQHFVVEVKEFANSTTEKLCTLFDQLVERYDGFVFPEVRPKTRKSTYTSSLGPLLYEHSSKYLREILRFTEAQFQVLTVLGEQFVDQITGFVAENMPNFSFWSAMDNKPAAPDYDRLSTELFRNNSRFYLTPTVLFDMSRIAQSTGSEKEFVNWINKNMDDKLPLL